MHTTRNDNIPARMSTSYNPIMRHQTWSLPSIRLGAEVSATMTTTKANNGNKTSENVSFSAVSAIVDARWTRNWPWFFLVRKEWGIVAQHGGQRSCRCEYRANQIRHEETNGLSFFGFPVWVLFETLHRSPLSFNAISFKIQWCNQGKENSEMDSQNENFLRTRGFPI